jgi:hypothetical protein
VLQSAVVPAETNAGPCQELVIEGWYNVQRLHGSLGYRSPAEYGTALAA